jgi:hypothetical protein
MIVKLVNLNVSGHAWIVLDVKRELLVFELLVYFLMREQVFPATIYWRNTVFSSLKHWG